MTLFTQATVVVFVTSQVIVFVLPGPVLVIVPLQVAADATAVLAPMTAKVTASALSKFFILFTPHRLVSDNFMLFRKTYMTSSK
jgi:hypothetical protein